MKWRQYLNILFLQIEILIIMYFLFVVKLISPQVYLHHYLRSACTYKGRAIVSFPGLLILDKFIYSFKFYIMSYFVISFTDVIYQWSGLKLKYAQYVWKRMHGEASLHHYLRRSELKWMKSMRRSFEIIKLKT